MKTSFFEVIRLYYNTIKFLKPSQIVNQIFFKIKIVFIKPIFCLLADYRTNSPTYVWLGLHSKTIPNILCDIKKNEFTFLNKTTQYQKIKWNDSSHQKLWLYHLHYFDYIIPSIKKPQKKSYLAFKRIIHNWIQDNPIGEGNGWEPYPSSLRIVNWIFFFDAFYTYFDEDIEFKQEFINSLMKQIMLVRFLKETHILANHYLTNIKALVISACYFDLMHVLIKNLEKLNEQLNEQILNDGGHYERSPMYHSFILTDILDLYNVLSHYLSKKSDNKNLKYIQSSIDKLNNIAIQMLKWLKIMTHPDGKIALFGDSTLNGAKTYEELKTYALELNIEAKINTSIAYLEESGYLIMGNNQHFLLLDCGDLGVKYQPGHAHCDLFSYEYSFNALRFIVDSGIGEYLPTQKRMMARGIKAHNTVVVNDLEQAEIWSAFRMGNRLTKKDIAVSEANSRFFLGTYINKIYKETEYIHTRQISLVNDEIFHFYDTITTNVSTSIYSLIHLHPDCKITENNFYLEISRKATKIVIAYDPNTTIVKVSTFNYYSDFGVESIGKLLLLEPKKMHQLKIQYCICSFENRRQGIELLSRPDKY